MDYNIPPPIVQVTRGSIVESTHRAHICVADSDGRILLAQGNLNHVAYLRSSAKPFQTGAMIVAGTANRYKLTGKQLALISGSHSGETIHTETVVKILAKGGIKPEALQCGIHPPFDAEARKQLRESGIKPTALHHNCSGKHAGMLLTTKHYGESLEDYLDQGNKIQQGIIEFISSVADIPAHKIIIGLDGCSAPVHGMPLYNGALAYARLIHPDGLPDDTANALKTVAEAMRVYPEMVAANQNRICTELIRTGKPFNMIAKAGAEGYYAVGWIDPDSQKGIGMTIKVEDGSQRGRSPLVIALLQRFKVLPDVLPENLIPFAAHKLTNHRGLKVGEVRVNM
ncbi:MAG: asparaginase [Candidatus Hatepunaea meridiana]|nr:asparaginase [Candidatus Hatepunaea meridiana]